MIELIISLIERYLNSLDGLFLGLGVLLALAITIWTLSSKIDRAKYKRLLLIYLLIGISVVIASKMVGSYRVHTLAFSQNSTGVLVMRIAGDSDNALQRDLVNSLRSRLRIASMNNDIVVKVCDESIDDTESDTVVAQQLARKIGAKYKAEIVVWGDRVGENKFWPNVTLVNVTNDIVLSGERTLGVQDIGVLKLPPELVGEPVFLSLFIAGSLREAAGEFKEALDCFVAASKDTNVDSVDLAPLRFETAQCYLSLAQSSTNSEMLYSFARDQYESAAKGFLTNHLMKAWAMAENDLGLTYVSLAASKVGDDSRKFAEAAVEAFQKSLKVNTLKNDPSSWAIGEMNVGLGLACEASIGKGTPNLDEDKLLGESSSAFRLVLVSIKKKQQPTLWALTQMDLSGNLLGQSERTLNVNDKLRFLIDSSDAIQSALKVFHEDSSSDTWAALEMDLGNTVEKRGELEYGTNALPVFSEAINAYVAALNVYSKSPPGQGWARTKLNLGNALVSRAECQGTGLDKEDLIEGIKSYQMALTVFSPSCDPDEWANAQGFLGTAIYDYSKCVSDEARDRLENKAVDIFIETLKYITIDNSPAMYAMLESDLGEVLKDQSSHLVGEDSKRKLALAFTAYSEASRVLTLKTSPEDFMSIETKLGFILLEVSDRVEKESADRLLSMAVSYFRNALNSVSSEQSPTMWATAQLNLGQALQKQAANTWGVMTQENKALLDQALIASRSALKIFTITNDPERWCDAEINVGVELSDEARLLPVDGRNEMRGESLKAFNEALKVLKVGEYRWLLCNMDMSGVLAERGYDLGGREAKQLQADAESVDRNILNHVSKTDFPTIWAMVELNMGVTLMREGADSTGAQRQRFLLEASSSFDQAELVYTEHEFPLQWGRLMDSKLNLKELLEQK